MPRPRSPRAEWIAVAIVALALPPALRATALAATAGTLFEAAPFVLAAALVPPGRVPGGALLRRALGFIGCGCGGSRMPGALALPALGLCWFAFGPFVTLGRAAVALLVALLLRRRDEPRSPHAGSHHGDVVGADPLTELERVVPAAVGAVVLAEMLRTLLAPGTVAPLVAIVVGLALGLLLGLLTPCATGAIAIGAGLREISPVACGAILATAGIFSWRDTQAARAVERARDDVPRRDPMRCEPRSARAALALLALACATLALHGPAGFVNPRFAVPIALAAVAAAFLTARAMPRTRARWPLAVPAVLLGAYIVGSPLPSRDPVATVLDDPYPGEAIRFVGALAPDGSNGGADGRIAKRAHATLVRYVITCCRTDAEARAVRLDRSLPGSRGTWYAATGTLASDPAGYVLHVGTIRRIAAPVDPFAYR